MLRMQHYKAENANSRAETVNSRAENADSTDENAKSRIIENAKFSC